jgi:hypothetical protein
VQAYLQACVAFAEFSRYNELTTAEIEAIGNLAQGLGLNLPRTPLQTTDMTKSEAAELQLRWTKQRHPSLCEHPNVELEQTEGGDVSGTYRCTTCGEVVPV